MKNKNIYYVLIAVLLLSILLVISMPFFKSKNNVEPITEELAEDITYVNASADIIKVELPFPEAVVGREFSVIGQARGTWFFEASFPIEVRDKDNKLLTTVVAQAQSEWMTENFVPFKAEVKIPLSYTGSATLVLKKDNPSGLPEHDAFIFFPITIK